MKAAFIKGYGAMDKVQIGEQPMPDVASGHVLIKIKAAGVNPIDWKIVKGDLKPLFRPALPQLLGSEGAGVIAQLGRDVTGFAIGDEVYFRAFETETGTYADYYSVAANLVALKPSNMSFKQAASIPLAGLTAMQALVEKGVCTPDRGC